MSLLEEATLDVLARHEDHAPFAGRPFTRVRVVDTFHGPRFPLPSGRSVHHLAFACEDGHQVPALRDVLVGADRNPVRDAPVTELLAAMSKLIAVTSALERVDGGLGTTTIERVYAGGSSSTPARRAWFEHVYGGRFVELFGSTEVWQGNCQRCVACGLYHEPLTVVHEYLPVVFPEPYRELVVTTYVPYALAMPLVRYRTGDLVRLGPRCPTTGKLGFDYVGRVADTRHFPASGLVLSPLPVARAVAALPGIARIPLDDLLERERPVPDLRRLPIYSYEAGDRGQVRLRIEMPVGADPATAPTDELVANLAAEDERIPAHLKAEFVPSGSLTDYAFH
jgi:hypothetical protein